LRRGRKEQKTVENNEKVEAFPSTGTLDGRPVTGCFDFDPHYQVFELAFKNTKFPFSPFFYLRIVKT